MKELNRTSGEKKIGLILLTVLEVKDSDWV